MVASPNGESSLRTSETQSPRIIAGQTVNMKGFRTPVVQACINMELIFTNQFLGCQVVKNPLGLYLPHANNLNQKPFNCRTNYSSNITINTALDVREDASQ